MLLQPVVVCSLQCKGTAGESKARQEALFYYQYSAEETGVSNANVTLGNLSLGILAHYESGCKVVLLLVLVLVLVMHSVGSFSASTNLEFVHM